MSEFVERTGASPSDALSCLKTWGWELNRALTDYNGQCNDISRNTDLIDHLPVFTDTSTNDYFLNEKLNLRHQQQQEDPTTVARNSLNGDGRSNNTAHNPIYGKTELNKPPESSVDVVDCEF